MTWSLRTQLAPLRAVSCLVYKDPTVVKCCLLIHSKPLSSAIHPAWETLQDIPGLDHRLSEVRLSDICSGIPRA